LSGQERHPDDPGILSSFAQQRKGEESGARGLHAHTADDAECHDAGQHTLESAYLGWGSVLTIITVAPAIC
jgi:hypothetical protein